MFLFYLAPKPQVSELLNEERFPCHVGRVLQCY